MKQRRFRFAWIAEAVVRVGTRELLRRRASVQFFEGAAGSEHALEVWCRGVRREALASARREFPSLDPRAFRVAGSFDLEMFAP